MKSAGGDFYCWKLPFRAMLNLETDEEQRRELEDGHKNVKKNNYMSSFSMCFRQQRDYASHAHTFIINFKFILEELWY